VAARGLERHADNPEAHDQMARIHVDRGDLGAACEAWEMVLRIVPGHAGALKGIAFVRFQQGRHDEAERLLLEAQGREADGEITAAIATVRRSGALSAMSATQDLPVDPRRLFAGVLGEQQTAIMLDKDGLVVAGAYYTSEGRDVAEDVGVTLAGLSGEALRATKYLRIGRWKSIVFETEGAVVSMTPAPAGGALEAGGLIVIAASADTPLGQLRRLLDRCVSRAARWLSGESA
jgi:predicted regulator of Ras-like GTPase activity (Roadblock/LC7/MglB family)